MGEFNRGSRRDFGSRGPRKDFNGRRNFGEEQEKHDAICSKCKKPCKVPFKPRPGSEVFCQECYRKIKGF